jgi:hypothetical protein
MYTCPQSGVVAETLLEKIAAEPSYLAINLGTALNERMVKHEQPLGRLPAGR